MALISKDLEKVSLSSRAPQETQMQGEYVESGERYDGKGEGLSAGIAYKQPEDAGIRGPYKEACRVSGALCYDAPMQSFRTDMLVQALMQNYVTPPVTLRQIAAGQHSAYALLTDGSVLYTGIDTQGEGDCTAWTDVSLIDADIDYVLGLTPGGVVHAGNIANYSNQIDAIRAALATWQNVTALASGWTNILGLKADGTVYHTNPLVTWGLGGASNWWFVINTAVAAWSGIVKVAAGPYHVLGLKADGTVVAAGDDADSRVSGVASWSNITDIACARLGSLGLRSDGTVVGVGSDYGNVIGTPATWSGITGIWASRDAVIGLKSDGTAVTSGIFSSGGGTAINEWAGIAECAIGDTMIMGRTSCRVFAAGNDTYGPVSGAESLFDYCL